MLKALKLITLCLAVTIISCINPKKEEAKTAMTVKPQEAWIFNKASGSMLEFTNGKGLNTRLSNPEYIGQLNNGNEAPYILYSGSSCNNCESKIYIHALAPTAKKNKLIRYLYPSTIISNGKTLYKSRMFYGEVLKGRHGLINYLEQYSDDNTMQKSVFLVSLKDGVTKHSVMSNSSQIGETLELLEEGKCKEIKGQIVKTKVPESKETNMN